jgi:hypothetical protein
MADFAQSTQIVFFVDLLGSSAIVQSNQPDKVAALTKMLDGVKSVDRNFSVTEASMGERNLSYAMPAISTFSDHLVLSFDIAEMAPYIDAPYREACWFARTLIGAFAYEALGLGMLIRGGATVNSLYHKNGVVVGPGLIDAYDLERLAAKYPRIVVSRKLYQASEGPFDEILTDDDGIKHFNYISEMIDRPGWRKQEKIDWIDAACSVASKNISAFEGEEKWNEMSKWVWFEKNLAMHRAELILE